MNIFKKTIRNKKVQLLIIFLLLIPFYLLHYEIVDKKMLPPEKIHSSIDKSNCQWCEIGKESSLLNKSESDIGIIDLNTFYFVPINILSPNDIPYADFVPTGLSAISTVQKQVMKKQVTEKPEVIIGTDYNRKFSNINISNRYGNIDLEKCRHILCEDCLSKIKEFKKKNYYNIAIIDMQDYEIYPLSTYSNGFLKDDYYISNSIAKQNLCIQVFYVPIREVTEMH